MSPIFISSIIGILLTVMTLGAITPSVSQAIVAKRVETSIAREEALVQQVTRYGAVTGNYPTSIQDLVNNGYWNQNDSSNGFGGTYGFTIDANKKTITITSTVADANTRLSYLNNPRRIFKTTDAGGGVLSTTFIIPTADMAGAIMPTAANIPIGGTAPSAASNTYWYDTSSGTAILKVSNGATWTAATSAGTGGGGGLAAPSSSNIVNSVSSLPTTANTGDVRYVYDSTGNVLNAYVYYNGQWAQASSGSNSASTLATSVAVTSMADCSAFGAGATGLDGAGNQYTCQGFQEMDDGSGVTSNVSIVQAGDTSCTP